MIVFGGSVSRNLAERVSKELNAEQGLLEYRRFPDGEHYLRILSGVEDKECVLVQSTDSNDSFMELLLLLDALRDLDVRTIHTVMPYMGYSRQDKRFKEGEAFSAKTVLKLVDQFSDSITTVNCHFLDAEGLFEFEGVNIRNLDAGSLVVSYFNDSLDNPLIVSPDEGALEYVRRAAEKIGCEFDFLEKTRISDNEVRMSAKKMDVSGRDIIILDDMISTGGTIVEASTFLRSQGAKSVRAGCVHGVFSKGLKVFDRVLEEVICSDTIPQEVSKVSVAELISKAIPDLL